MGPDKALFVGSGSGGPQWLRLDRANRHGLIAGATGTGKTVTLQGLAEDFSAAGVPVFLADIKGDLAGLAMPATPSAPYYEKLAARAVEVGLTDYAPADTPVIFWDLLGEQGHPVRTTVTEMGPLLLGRLMGLNETQEGVLNIAFRAADDEGMLLLNLDDLQSMLTFCADNAGALSSTYGNVARATVGAIQRQLLALETQGGDRFFGEPALRIADFMQIDDQGRGQVSILAADKLMANPRLYATFLLWLLSELFEDLPEVGDPEKPRLVFFFDEAHLLFDDAPKALIDKIEQVVRLIRSKGVGIFFVTQNPIDIPDEVSAQLGNRIQHALRAFTPRDQKAVAAAAETFRPNPAIDVAAAITELRTGEALVSLLQEDGSPSPVERTLIRPPRSRLGPLEPKERAIIRTTSPVDATYDREVDRESAYEMLKARGEQAIAEAERVKSEKEAEKARIAEEKARAAEERERRRNPTLQDQMMNQVGRAVQRQIANKVAGQIVRGILGGLFGRR